MSNPVPNERYDERVTGFIAGLPEWMSELAARVRELIHEAEPAILETIKRTDRPYFEFAGNVAAFQATKDHLNVFIYDPAVPDPAHLINQGSGNQSAQSIQIYEGDLLDESAFRDLIAAICARNRAGGWRKLQG